MKALGLVIKEGIQATLDLGLSVIQWAEKNGWPVYVDVATNELLHSYNLDEKISALQREELTAFCDVIVTMGGDGTLIGIARHVTSKQTIMIGVNFGTLGFLTEIRPEELLSCLESVRDGTAIIGERKLLHTRVVRRDEEIFSSQALNDVVIQKGAKGRLLEIDVWVDEQPLTRIRGDGVIIATPTGSTAYSLAAGGSIVSPGLSVTLVTPICPHSLTVRPLILSSSSTIKITFPPYDGKIFTTVDGQVSCDVMAGDFIEVTPAENAVHLARSSSRNYFDILTRKLNWGIANSAN